MANIFHLRGMKERKPNTTENPLPQNMLEHSVQDIKDSFYANPEIFPCPTRKRKTKEIGKLYTIVFKED